VQLLMSRKWTPYLYTLILCGITYAHLAAQDSNEETNHAGHVPIISGGFGYIHNVNGGVPTLMPQIDPVLVAPFGRRFLLESRTDFTGVFQREDLTSGPYKGSVFTSVDYAQLDWLVNTHVMPVGGKYLLPFGLYNERLGPIWVKNLQDPPFTVSIGTRTSGAGDGLLLRGVAVQTPTLSTQYSAYYSVHCGVEQLQSARTAGGDVSVFFSRPRFEIGTSYQRFLESRHINNSAVYISWQPLEASLDVKSEYDYSYFGSGYWIEGAYRLDRLSLPSLIQKVQFVGRMQQVFPHNGGGNGIPQVRTDRFDAGLNYYLRDNLRIISSYARSFSSQRNANVWDVGFTYRFTIPLWFGGKR
jgi:hypothetical protein